MLTLDPRSVNYLFVTYSQMDGLVDLFWDFFPFMDVIWVGLTQEITAAN
jgi:hypothetical protein